MPIIHTGWGNKKPEYPVTEVNGIRYKICRRCLENKEVKDFPPKTSWDKTPKPYCKECLKRK